MGTLANFLLHNYRIVFLFNKKKKEILALEISEIIDSLQEHIIYVYREKKN